MNGLVEKLRYLEQKANTIEESAINFLKKAPLKYYSVLNQYE